jgi:chromosome segregation protein
VLSAIYIKGFKTFARPVRMPLTGGITAIVGPNGSGKSNITDAVLFALGEGSPSILRAGLMNDLIFSGSESLSPAAVAEVTLVLDNATGEISLPYEEVSLTRRISRGGETDYKINGVRTRLTDVRTVAGEAGLGRHSVLRQGAERPAATRSRRQRGLGFSAGAASLRPASWSGPPTGLRAAAGSRTSSRPNCEG